MFKYRIAQEVSIDGEEAEILEQLQSSDLNYYKLLINNTIRYEYERFIEPKRQPQV